MSVDIKVLAADIMYTYPAVYQRLQNEYRVAHKNGIIPSSTSEEDYILMQMPLIMDERTKNFKEADINNRVSAVLSLFTKEKCAAVQDVRYPTGYRHLDEALNGGFIPGVHYIGAISSLGKSTFGLQMADQMASRRIPVLYVSMEMSKTSLVAKLISLHLFTDVGERWAKTSSDLTSVKMNTYTDEEWDAIGEAVSAISSHADYLTIMDARARVTSMDDVARYVQDYTLAYGIAPVVIVDYLQILTPPEGMSRATDKQLVDRNVVEFRTLAAEYDIPVIVISSFNRDNYDNPVSNKSYKDSGNIEYSSDTLIGLQLHGIGKPGFDAETAKAASIRKIELVILKQRNGPVGIKISYDFFTLHSYFEEQSVPTTKKVYRTN